MKQIKLTLLGMFTGAIAIAQSISTPSPSPGTKLVQDVGLTTVTVEYSRPGKKDREIFGGLVPYNEWWRTGANAATKITFDKDVVVGDQELKSGSYALLTKPSEAQWTVNFYPYESGGWTSYTSKTPAASINADATTQASVAETFTIDINSISSEGASLDLVWDQTKVSVPLKVKTDEEVMSQISNLEQSTKNSQANSYHQAAAYLLSQKKDLETALKFSTDAVSLRPDAFWMSRTQSLILAELGRTKEAIAAAEKSKAAAEKANNNQYVQMNEESIASWKKSK